MAHVRKQQISFFLTTKCNLDCKYCYTLKKSIKKEHQTLNFNFAKRALNDFFRDYPSRQIRFYGVGEPTIEFELMKKIKDYAHELVGEELKVELQTNGYFSEKLAEWVAENVDILWISCDGLQKFKIFKGQQGKAKVHQKLWKEILDFLLSKEICK